MPAPCIFLELNHNLLRHRFLEKKTGTGLQSISLVSEALGLGRADPYCLLSILLVFWNSSIYASLGLTVWCVLCHQIIIKAIINIKSLRIIVVISRDIKALVKTADTLWTSWDIHTNTNVVTTTLSRGWPGISTRMPLVSWANQIWYWPINNWKRKGKYVDSGTTRQGFPD